MQVLEEYEGFNFLAHGRTVQNNSKTLQTEWLWLYQDIAVWKEVRSVLLGS